jgi:GNAT superfamily N-acetyltransferase
MARAEIRDAVMGDAAQVAELITELGYPTAPEAMRDRLALILVDSNYATLVADTGGNVVGVAGASLDRYYEKDGLYSRLLVLAVSSKTRGLGIGGQLVQTLERWAASNGAREMFVNSGTHRLEAHLFYERRGYSRTGFRFVKQLSA